MKTNHNYGLYAIAAAIAFIGGHGPENRDNDDPLHNHDHHTGPERL
jgi:hypothetical protein